MQPGYLGLRIKAIYCWVLLTFYPGLLLILVRIFSKF